jgi:signal peptidase I
MPQNPFAYQNLEEQEKPKGFNTKRFVDIIQGFVVFLALLVIAYLFFVIPSQVDGSSMYPNLVDNEILLTNRLVQIIGGPGKPFKNYDYQRGDIVVFKLENFEKDLIKRVIGLPGDTVMIKDYKVFVNGELLNEQYIDFANYPTEEDSFMQEGIAKTVPEGYYFVLGDNRPGSKDSRNADVGFVERKRIKGSPFLRLYPFNKLTYLKRGEYTLGT